MHLAMRIKPVITIVLSLFVLVSVAVVLKRQAAASGSGEPADGRIAEAAEAPGGTERVEEVVTGSVEPSIQEASATVEPGAPAIVEPVAAAGSPGAVPHVAEPEPAVTTANRRVLAFYFHGDARCWTCRTVEAYAKEAVELGFPERVADGSVVFLAVNVERAENRHYIDDFQLTSRTVVVAEEVDGVIVRWSRLDKVWQLANGHDLYLEYVRRAVNDLLKQG
jgi:hypothetical protein